MNFQSDILMSILSNHATASVVKVQGEIDVKDLARGERTGEEVAKRMERASVVAASIFIVQQHIIKVL